MPICPSCLNVQYVRVLWEKEEQKGMLQSGGAVQERHHGGRWGRFGGEVDQTMEGNYSCG